VLDRICQVDIFAIDLRRLPGSREDATSRSDEGLRASSRRHSRGGGPGPSDKWRFSGRESLASATRLDLRTDTDAVQFVRSFFEAGKPVGMICHGPWTLINAGVVDGRTLTSWLSLQTDLRNAGAEWVDEEVHVDQGLVSSRKPDDLDAFNAKIVEEFAEGVHEVQREATSAVAAEN
jgi:hypothetical protein